MTLLILLLGAPVASQSEPPAPPEEERRGGGQIGNTVAVRRQKRIYVSTVEYREAEEEMVILWL